MTGSPRQCGDCQLCCKLLPVRELAKPDNQRCRHQKHGKGCNIYVRRPRSCFLWNCRWLAGDIPADLPRPDRARYVIDIMPEFITLQNNEDATTRNFPVIQIWVDPLHPLAYRDHRLLDWLDEQWCRRGILGLVRFDSKSAITMIPPSATGSNRWLEKNGTANAEHSAAEIHAAIGDRIQLVQA